MSHYHFNYFVLLLCDTKVLILLVQLKIGTQVNR